MECISRSSLSKLAKEKHTQSALKEKSEAPEERRQPVSQQQEKGPRRLPPIPHMIQVLTETQFPQNLRQEFCHVGF